MPFVDDPLCTHFGRVQDRVLTFAQYIGVESGGNPYNKCLEPISPIKEKTPGPGWNTDVWFYDNYDLQGTFH